MTANTARELTDLEWLIQKIEVLRAAWKLVLVSFLTLSILGCVMLFFVVPPVYSSQMVLPLTLNQQALIHTDAILGPVVRKRSPTGGPDISLASKIDVSELKKGSGLFSISVRHHSPQAAQAILQEVLAQIISASKPLGTNLASLQQQLESQRRALTELKDLSVVLRENAPRAKNERGDESHVRSYAILVSEIAAKEQRIWELQSLLEGFRIEDVVVPPTLASRTDSRWRLRELAATLLISLLLPVAFLLLRDLWRRRNSSRDNHPNVHRAA